MSFCLREFHALCVKFTRRERRITLAPELLADYNALVFLNRDSGEPLSSEDKLALRGFLGAGNGVLVLGQQDGNWPLSPAAKFADSVTLPYGIELTTMIPNTNTPPTSNRLVAHPVTKGLSSVPGGGSLLRVIPPAQLLALTGTNTGVRRYRPLAPGEWWSSAMIPNLWDSTIDRAYSWGAQERLLGVNILKWVLLQRSCLEASQRLDDQGYHLALWAGVSQTVLVQRSADLRTWADWDSFTATGAWQEVVDTSATTGGHQFYRAVLVP